MSMPENQRLTATGWGGTDDQTTQSPDLKEVLHVTSKVRHQLHLSRITKTYTHQIDFSATIYPFIDIHGHCTPIG